MIYADNAATTKLSPTALADYYTKQGKPVPPECKIDGANACPSCG